jgi:pimeloyl-ACP methyl ester carboxylesterase
VWTCERIPCVLASIVLCGALVGCDAEEPAGEATDGVEAEVYAELEARSGQLPQELCEKVYSFDHFIPVGNGVTLHVVEKLTARSVLRVPRRAMLMLTGTLVTNEQYDLDVDAEGLNALDRAAQAGYFAFSATYEGYDGSTLPADGSTVTADRLIGQMGVLVEWIRWHRLVPQVDLLGSSLGSSLAVALGGTQSPINRHHVGKAVLTAVVHEEVTPLFQSIFFSPEVQALLEGAPNGYVPTGPEQYGLILDSVDPAAAAYGFANFPGVYATGPTLEGFDLPVYAAENGRAPVLQIWGDHDLITPLSDALEFQDDYGGPSELLQLPGAGHAPYYGEPVVRDAFWDATFDFLDEGRWAFFLACE